MSSLNRVTLELTNRCNRRCADCPSLKTDYPFGHMSWELFNRIIEQLPSETTIVPFFRGESLAHPLFVDFMGQLKRFDQVQLATNGDYLTVKQRDAILEACSFVSFSIHKLGFPDDYRRMKTLLVDARKEGIVTQVSILDNLLYPGDKQPFIDSWLEHVDRVRVYVKHSAKGFGDVEFTYHILGEEKACYKPFNETSVYWDGKVALCCYDWNNMDNIGDLNLSTVDEVWNGEKYREIRDLHSKGCLKEVNSCKDCDYWMLDYIPNKRFGELYTSDSV